MNTATTDFVYNPFEFATQHNPYPVYARMRDDAPVYHNPDLGFYALSRHADVLAAHKDPKTFISSQGVTLEGGEKGQELLITKDPPEHEWHRKVVSRVFTPRRVSDLEPFMREYCGVLLDRFRDDPGFDVVEQFSIQLPLEVIGELLGIPSDKRQEVHHLADRLFTRGDEVMVSDDAATAMLELGLLLYDVVVERRKDLGDDVISLLIRSEVTDDDGREFFLTDEQLASRILELAFAGHETVARLIANGVVALAWYPDQRRELASDPDLLPNAVEEMLRWDAPSHYQGRWTTEAVTLHGVTIPVDQRVILVTGAANHDERVYEEPGLFDLHRKMDGTVSFGYGVHFCLGAALARLETRVAFGEFLARFPDYEIDESGVERMRASNVRGLAKLPILVDR
jgi:cytochrome P450